MKKKIARMATIGAISLNIILSSLNVNAMSNKIITQPLTKYNSNEVIMLRDKPIEIPVFAEEKQEQFRGVWVSTVYNLDFPSKQGISQDEYKAEYIKLLNNLESLNMNVVIFQVRPELDAFYPSNLNPWSKWLTGEQGKSPGWDPLEWMVEETHRRGMEFHAWFNPYMVTRGKEELSDLAPNNWARLNPQYTYKFAGRIYLNPGEPEVVRYINDSVMEVVENYNIDAVHFDDYFYPFKNGDNWYAQEDELAYMKYGYGMDRDTWRRNNVDMLIKTIHDSLESYNERNQEDVQFGVSPFGIWGKLDNHPEGSSEGVGALIPYGSRASYDDQFVDTRKWVKNNWLDYIAPQVYWAFDEKAAPYGELVNWWADVVRGTDVNLYIGHANHKKAKNANNISWQNPREISNQLKFNSLYDEVKGSIFFSYKYLLENEPTSQANREFINILKNEHFINKASLPSKNVIEDSTNDPTNEPPEDPTVVDKELETPFGLMVIRTSYGYIVIWEDSPDNHSTGYRIYREDLIEDGEINKNIIREVIRGDYNKFVFIDKGTNPDMDYIYSITAIDENYNESDPLKLK